MAKKITIDIEVNGKMQKATVSAKKLRSALDGVDKAQEKVGKSARTTDRNIKGAAQASANGTKNFSKMAQGITNGLVPAYATLAAQVFAVSAVFQFLRDASDISNLIAGQEALAQTTGVAYKSISNSLREATLGQLSYAEASRAAAIGTASGLNPQQLEGLATAAKNASVALGRDLTDSFNRLIRGVTKAEPELLDELGIILRLEPATAKYAAMIGKSANELDAFERSQAVANEVLGQAEQKFGALESVLDPSTASLNRFIQSFDDLINQFKVGLIDKLRPVFDFLSENTTGLTAALTLFALPIIKSIIPSFEDWRKAGQETLKEQEAQLARYSKALQNTELDLKKIGKKQKEIRKGAVSQATGAFTAAGIDLPRPSPKTAGGADFLLGRADSAQAAANAEKILTNAEKQLRNHAKVQSGTLKGANAQQVADMRQSYLLRKGILDQHGVVETSFWKEADLKAEKYYTKGQIMMTRFRSFMTASSIFISRALNAMFAATGIIGLISLIGSVGYEIYRAFVPVDEKMEKFKEDLKEATEKAKTLNEELARVPKALSMEKITLDKKVQAVGNAVTSANLPQVVADFEEIAKTADHGSEEFENYKQKTLNTFVALSKLDKRFAQFGVELGRTGTLTERSKEAMAELSKELISTGVASSQLPRVLQQINQELAKLFGKPQGTVFDTLMSQTQQAARLASQELKGALRTQDTLNDRAVASLLRFSAVSEAGARQPDLRKNPAFVEKYNTAKSQSAADTAAAEAGKQDLKLIRQRAREQNELNIITKVSVANNHLLIEAARTLGDERQSLLRLQTQAVTKFDAQQIANNARLLKDEQKLKDLEAEKGIAADMYARATMKGSKLNEIQKNNLRIAAKSSEEKYENALAELGVTREQVKLQNTLLELQKQIQPVVEQKTILQLQQQMLKIAEKRAGFAKEILAEEEKQLRMNVERGLREERRRNPFAFLDEDRRRAEAMYDLEVALSEKKEKQVEAEYKLKVEAINMEYDLMKIQLQIQKNALLQQRKQMYGEDATLTEEQKGLFSGIEAQIEPARAGALAAADASRKSAAQGIREAVDAAKEGKEDLMDINVLTDGIATRLEDGMVNAFASIVDGTKSAKQAFADMAKSILQYIIQMTIKMLIFRAISSFMGAPATAPAPANPTPFSSIDEFFRYGGISKDPKKMRYGGVMSNGREKYSTGGIARGPDAGYLATLHGTEAIVPLPNGREIPVQLTGAGQQNNVTVNVAVDNQGNAQTNVQNQEGQAKQLGVAISAAVQQELAKQKRVGGMLSPYGVS